MKKRLLTIIASVAMVVAMLPSAAFAASAPVAPWYGDGSVDVVADGTYRLFGNENGVGPNAKATLPEDADMANGFKISANLELSEMSSDESALWSFGVTGSDDTCMDEAVFRFFGNGDGTATLSVVGDGHSNNIDLDTAVTAGKFNISAAFSPDESGKLAIAYFANGNKVANTTTEFNYADVKGPRFGWLASTTAKAGIVVNGVPTAEVLHNPSAPVAPWYGDGGVDVVADGTYRLFGNENGVGPNAKATLPEDADMTNGFKISANLDLSEMSSDESVLWSFGVTGSDDTCMDEAVFRFFGNGDGTATLSVVGDGHSNNIDLDTAVTAGTFDISAEFTPDESGKLAIAYFANGNKIATTTTDFNYADVKGPRFGWLASTTAKAGIVVNGVPAAEVIHKHKIVKHDAKAPTCTEAGWDAYETCETCDYTTFAGEIPAVGHTFGEWTTITSPSCVDKGGEQRTCDVCGYTETRDIEATGHEWEEEATVDEEPTCTEEGSSSIHCKHCDAVKDSITIPALGHDFDENGVCTICGEEDGVVGGDDNADSSNAEGNDDAVKTGDDTNLIWPICLALASLLGLGGVAFTRKRFNH